MISRVKGTQDFCDVTYFNATIDSLKKHIALYNFTEIVTPILEPFELFHRSLGEFTDVVSKEMFFIQSHEGSHEKICLRPEATASTVRAFLENGIQKTPWKVFSYGPMFRYERPQKGRFRQFHQINMEIIGSNSIFDDVQFLYMLDHYFSQKLYLQDYTLSLNYLGCSADRIAYTETLTQFLQKPEITAQLCPQCTTRATKNCMRVFDCKNQNCQQLYTNAPVITDHLCSSCNTEWNDIQKNLLMLSVTFVHNTHLVRGLDYYNKTVFEFSSPHLGSQNAFCGGGRYDSLVKEIGGKQDHPSIGAAIGIERVMLLLQIHNDPRLAIKKEILTVIIPLSDAQRPLGLFIATTLQKQNICAEVNFSNSSIKTMMRAADKAAARFVILLGDDEQHNNTATVKDMLKGTQVTVKQTEVAHYILQG